MNKSKLFCSIILLLFFISPLSSSSNVYIVDQETIKLDLYTNRGNRIRTTIALYIAEALKPIGIDVNLHFEPFGLLVSKLLHLHEGPAMDLSLIGFAGGTPFDPVFKWKMHSTDTSFGQLMYQLNNPDWSEFMAADIGITTAEIDALIESIDYELNRQTRISQTRQLDELYLDQLLYDVPLVSAKNYEAIHTGFTNGNPYTSDMGLDNAMKLGYSWSPNPTYRVDDADQNTLQIAMADPGSYGMFDPYQSFDTSTTMQTEYMVEPLLNIDHTGIPHPGLAYQWFVEDATYDADGDPGTVNQFVEAGKHTFLINTSQWVWPATTDYLGNTVPPHNFDANDIALALEMYKNPRTLVDGKSNFDNIINWEVKTTIFPSDTLTLFLRDGTPTISDYLTYGSLIPLPDHLLGGDLLYNNGTEGIPEYFTINMGTTNFTQLPFNPQLTEEWKHWASEIGHSLIGPMELLTFELASGGGFIEYSARSDYPYPNEWDLNRVYSIYQVQIDALEANTASTGYRIGGLSTFAPHLPQVTGNAYYWTYGDNPVTTTVREKPLAQTISTIILKNIPDMNSRLLEFESGALDVFASSALGDGTILDHINNPDLDVHEIYPITGPQLLVFDLTNEHLQKRNVRYAIASMINTTLLDSLLGLTYEASTSIVWKNYKDYYDPNSTFYPSYNYELARDLMRFEGYVVNENYQVDLNNVLGDLPSSFEHSDQDIQNLDPSLIDEYIVQDEQIVVEQQFTKANQKYQLNRLIMISFLSFLSISMILYRRRTN